MTPLADLRLRYPDHFLCRVVHHELGVEAVLAIPSALGEKAIPSMPGMTVELLDGGTMRLSGERDAK